MKITNSTSIRFLFPVLIFLAVTTIVYMQQHVTHQLDAVQTGAREQVKALGRLLNITDILVDEQSNISMRLLKEHSSALGVPAIDGLTNLDGMTIPNLSFGSTKITNNSNLVDTVTGLAGGTATIFVKSGDSFIRVATNVNFLHGGRALGTNLNPHGDPIKALRSGYSFQGVVNIFGKPYITRYDPMYNKNGIIIGAYYVGYQADMKVLLDAIHSTRYLKTGFAVLVDGNNEPRIISSHISYKQAERLLKDRPKNWNFVTENVPEWGSSVTVAYPISEALAIGFSSLWLNVSAVILISLLLIALIFRQMRHLILNPIGADPTLAIELLNRIASGNFEDDGLKAKPGTLIANVINMRQKLSEMLTVLHENSNRMSLSASVFNHAKDGIFIADNTMNIIEVNESFSKITGFEYQAAIGHKPHELGFVIHDVDFFKKFQDVHNLEAWNHRSDGELYAAWLDVFVVEDDAHNICNYVGIFSDITEKKQAEIKLRISETRFRTMIEAIPDAIFLKDSEGRWLIVNESAKQLYHLQGIPWQGKTDAELAKLRSEFHSIHKTCLMDDETTWLAGKMQVFSGTSITKDNQRLDLEVRKVPIYDEQGHRQALVTIGRNVTEQKQAEVNLRIAAIAFQSQEGMLVTDANQIILRVNQAFTSITGYSAEEAIGQTPQILKSEQHDERFYADLWETLNKTGSWEGEITNRRKNGEVYPEYLTITAVKDENGSVTNYVATLNDNTLRRAAEERIEDLAYYDSLTHLPNRRLFLDRLGHAMAFSARNNREGALLFLDLDHFKTINDTLGHDIGDLLLQQVAERLTSCVREGDTIARLGGDEFVVLLEDLSEDLLEAAAHTETIGEKIIAVLNQPYQLGSLSYQSTPSIGAVLFSDHHESLDDLLKHADIAMYQSKKLGRNRLSFFDPDMQESIHIRVGMERELRRAIDEQQFELYYQIQVNGLGHALGAEALIRWPHPERGMISPANFIPLAEDTGLILPIGQWVLETACAQLKNWQLQETTCDLILAVNVSAKQFLQLNFVHQVQDTVRRHGIDPTRLKLELTESMLLDNVDHIIITMNELKAIGISFSLDDFGTGYSSLQYLKKLPLNQLKIDRSFVRDITTDYSDRAIVNTIITMAKSMELEVIAEGVETDAQLTLLSKYGCKSFQGFLFGKASSIAQFEAALNQDSYE